MSSKALWKEVERLHNKLVRTIISFVGLKGYYKSTPEYQMSEWW
ncbi:hypothetical protein [Staphylococcus hyicus]